MQLASAPIPACPACGRPPGSTLACLHCGRLLDEPQGATHFQRLGLPAGQHVDRATLESAYLKLSRRLHPDFHGSADDDARALALRNSALLNEAYAVLSDDEQRAEYLLGLHDPQALERWKNLPPAFLMQAMETSEAVEGAAHSGDRPALARLVAGVRRDIDERLRRLADAESWRQPDARELATLLHELRVFRRILRDAEKAA
jgi:molecular chaperone HscB